MYMVLQSILGGQETVSILGEGVHTCTSALDHTDQLMTNLIPCHKIFQFLFIFILFVYNCQQN